MVSCRMHVLHQLRSQTLKLRTFVVIRGDSEKAHVKSFLHSVDHSRQHLPNSLISQSRPGVRSANARVEEEETAAAAAPVAAAAALQETRTQREREREREGHTHRVIDAKFAFTSPFDRASSGSRLLSFLPPLPAPRFPYHLHPV